MLTLLKDEEKRTVVFLVISFISVVISFFNIGSLPFNAAWVAILLCGLPIVKGAVVGLVTEFDIKADVLVSIALIASVIIGETFAAGEVAFIMAIGAFLEETTVAKARAGIEKLVHLTPTTARVVRNGKERIVPAEEVKVGDILRVLAGETIAVDGIIVSGQTSVNQALMTGESLPVDKSAGDEVSSGTVNQFGTFDMKATKVGEDSSLQRMIRLVQSADAGKAKIVGIADRWATWIVVIALTSAVLTWLMTGEIIRAVTILVVFCPCALVLATPTAIMAGIGNATKFGILIREGDALERLSGIKRIAFDKTGTLTYGKPDVAAVRSFDPALSDQELLSLAASVELRSEHPLGKAIVAHFKAASKASLPEPGDFQMLAGRGVSALVDGRAILAGNAELLRDYSVPLPPTILEKADEYRNDGCTIIFASVDGQASGFIALSDTLRPDAVDVVRNIEKLNVKSTLLTGDNHHAASHMAKIAGIDDLHTDCLPEHKMTVIEEYQRGGDLVCMVGDGVNDAPALKKAHVGIAMGGIGSDIAVEAADIALVSDDIQSIPHLLALSKRTMNTIKLNMALSMALNFAAIILAMVGLLGPVVGALVHNAGSVAVIINSSLLLKWKEHLSA
ncbi:copper/silver-translocating P-type ATPase [Desulfosporosinus orientis DSM 765]|uniref:Cd(2+)-exporting ATPase n=1 Tax=Desulfosporosinus orientis (strain ATCC 19365 / DSM 765 / NCIMB 8382 / VKM B-1628 / Singapore I) TaxID=768706 RepID=G7W8Z6_DESOD|nr:cation-translocating P-type ATPase [Desulfosporosinus orientis]AET68205.1 copper/silver-translocating P-type ATPase [Desulfosporosinus orientis DSM 765]